MKIRSDAGRVGGAALMLVLGLVCIAGEPVAAAPPSHAPAHGHRGDRGKTHGRDHKDDKHGKYEKHEDRGGHGRSTRSYTPASSAAAQARERRRRAEWLRTHPTTRPRIGHTSNLPRVKLPDNARPNRDYDRDGIPNSRDRDMDGDGRLNGKDSHPLDRRRK
jgi:hypothetical protein